MSSSASPKERYHADLQGQGFSADAAQAEAIAHLQQVYEDLIAKPPSRRFGSKQLRYPPVQGLYFWGGVGRGKTYLMDAFFDSLPFSRKRRTHFHRFMLEVHERRRQFTNTRDPLSAVANALADETRVLCFDEFFVSDIADAMILGGLLKALFARGVTLIATSNIAPDGLYQDGLQRANFLPAIEVLKAHVRVLNVDGGIDYRLRSLTDAALYLSPSNAKTQQTLEAYFQRFGGHGDAESVRLDINGREVRAFRHTPGVAWFKFADLCEGPRGAADYIELARTHRTVLLSEVPVFTPFSEDSARRFITLIDEFYDRNVKLIVAAESSVETLYQGDRLRFEFERTRSRLVEMRTVEYLQQPHRP
jgi:cell division protein ZapE